jgi:hypothetical protein
MVYTNRDASSSDLKPVLVSVTVVVAILFGGMFFYYQNSLKQETALNVPTAAPESQSTVAPAEAPVATAVKQKMRSRV